MPDAELGRIMALILDAADPSHTRSARDNAAEEAIRIDAESAGFGAISYLRAILNGVHGQFGPAAAAEMMRQMAAASAVVLDGQEESQP